MTPNTSDSDHTIPQGWSRYTPTEHATWRTLYERQHRLLPGRACTAFLRGLEELQLGPEGIPDFERLSDLLEARTGWRIVAVPGLVPDAVFFRHLANRRFPAGHFIRRPDQLDYLQEPDVFHDVFGHAPMLANPALADFMQAYGAAGLRAQGIGCLKQLARLYWYTIEFGLLREDGGLRLYGAGIASSYTESQFCLDSDSPHRVALDLLRVMRTHYRIDDLQEVYFVIDSLAQLLDFTRIDFDPIYAQALQASDLAPGDLEPADRVLQRGSGHYHAATQRARKPQI